MNDNICIALSRRNDNIRFLQSQPSDILRRLLTDTNLIQQKLILLFYILVDLLQLLTTLFIKAQLLLIGIKLLIQTIQIIIYLIAVIPLQHRLKFILRHSASPLTITSHLSHPMVSLGLFNQPSKYKTPIPTNGYDSIIITQQAAIFKRKMIQRYFSSLDQSRALLLELLMQLATI